MVTGLFNTQKNDIVDDKCFRWGADILKAIENE